MDEKLGTVAREREIDPSKISAAYRDHLRSGGTAQSFPAVAFERVRRAKEALERAEERTAHDLAYMLCRTAERVIPTWPDEGTGIMIEDAIFKEIPGYQSTSAIANGIRESRISGQIVRVRGAVIDQSYPIFLCSQGMFIVSKGSFDAERKMYFRLHDEAVPTTAILNEHMKYFQQLHLLGIQQHARQSLGELRPLNEYVGNPVPRGEGLRGTTGMPVAVERNDHNDCGIVASVFSWYRERSELQYLVCLPQGVDFHRRQERSPPPAEYYDRALDAIRFEKERREKGDPPVALMQYLRERDLK